MCWCWIAAQLGLVVVAVVDPRFASGLRAPRRVAIAGVGTGLIAFLALRGQDRALSLIPSWMLLLVWLFGAAMTCSAGSPATSSCRAWRRGWC